MSHSLPGFQYKLSLGQNFLFDSQLLHRLIDQTGISPEDTVLEIGAGRGDLTLALAKRCRQVITIEVDSRLEPVLSERFSGIENIELVMGDVMALDLPGLMKGYPPFHVAANLPYYLTTPILNLLFRLPLPLLSVNVMVQQEAARRVLAVPGTPEYGPLALLAKYKSLPRETLKVPASVFTPPPKVDSVFLVMPFLPQPGLVPDEEEFLFHLVAAAFAMRRKTLANNLMAAFHLNRSEAAGFLLNAGLPGDIRGERLSLKEFIRLASILQQETKMKNQ